MPMLSGIYDSAPIQPVCKIKENLVLWVTGQWKFFRADYIEPMPRSSGLIIDMVAQSGVTSIAANGTLNKQLVPALQLNTNEFLHLRWEPLDDVEGILYEQSSQGRFTSRSAQARVSLATSMRDPYLATTTFFILGMNYDMNLAVQNPLPVTQPQARFTFFGFRYRLTDWTTQPNGQDVINKITTGLQAATWLPAEGLQ